MSRILIVTLPPFEGGVPAKTAILAKYLRSLGHEITVAYYATVSKSPELSRTVTNPLNKPQKIEGVCFNDFNSVAVGCSFPELEFTYYLPSCLWNDLIYSHDYHIAVGGTVLVSYPLLKAKIPHLLWCASTMIEDRMDRRNSMHVIRRIIDKTIIGSIQSFIERQVLNGNSRILAVSSYAQKTLLALSDMKKDITIMPIPVDCSQFKPNNTTEEGLVGFAGRISDPRKNIRLLIDAVILARRTNDNIRLILTGYPDEETREYVANYGKDIIEFTGSLDRDNLIRFYQKLDIFVIPSKQEGFGIVGIEAMACGVPVVSTPCGGPSDYVIDNKTGFIGDFSPETISTLIVNIVSDRELRSRLSVNARNFAVNNYSNNLFQQVLLDSWYRCWGNRP